MVYAGSSSPRCIPGGSFGTPSTNGALVVVATREGQTGHVKGPGFESATMAQYSIQVLDVRTGDVRTVIPGVVSWEYQAPLIRWNEVGTHFLVVAPATTGL